MSTNPLLIDVPERLESARLVLRVPRAGGGAIVAASVRESLAELKPWMPWAHDGYVEKDGEEWCRKSAANFVQRTILSYTLWLTSGEHIGNVGAFAFAWDVPRCEIGYWLNTRHCGQGLMTEAVQCITAMLFDQLQFTRVEIRMDNLNDRSWRVAERCGFQHEGTLRRDCLNVHGQLRDTRIYSRLGKP